MTTTGKIILKTRLHDGIYRSSGGGQVRIHQTWKISPRNLLLAVRQLTRHVEHMTECYGNVGRGRSWLEYDGYPLSDIMTSIIDDTKEAAHFLSIYPTGEAYDEAEQEREAEWRKRDAWMNVS